MKKSLKRGLKCYVKLGTSERCQLAHSTPLFFFNWFVKEKSGDIKNSMLLSLREAAGLGSPPSPFTPIQVKA